MIEFRDWKSSKFARSLISSFLFLFPQSLKTSSAIDLLSDLKLSNSNRSSSCSSLSGDKFRATYSSRSSFGSFSSPSLTECRLSLAVARGPPAGSTGVVFSEHLYCSLVIVIRFLPRLTLPLLLLSPFKISASRRSNSASSSSFLACNRYLLAPLKSIELMTTS